MAGLKQAQEGQSGGEGLRAELLDAEAVACLCGFSTAHVRRMADRGELPAPVKVGALVRWNRRVIEAWFASGCPRNTKGGSR